MPIVTGTNENDVIDEGQRGVGDTDYSKIDALAGDDLIIARTKYGYYSGGFPFRTPVFVETAIDGGAGNDTLVLRFAKAWALSTAGHVDQDYLNPDIYWRGFYTSVENFDVVVSTYGTATLGNGNDRIDARLADGGNFSMGGGDDIVLLQRGRGTANMGAGSDRLVIEAASSDPAELLFTGTMADGYSGVFQRYGFNDFVDVLHRFSGVEHFTIRLTRLRGPLVTGDGDDVISSGGNADHVSAGGGSDQIDGDMGDDILVGGLGADELNGGGGRDTASYEDNAGAVSLDLRAGRGYTNAAFGDTYISIENVRGSLFNDYLIGGYDDNVLEGAGGDDVLIGSLGADVLDGGDGVDFASYEDNQGAVFIDLFRNAGFGNAAQGDTYIAIENLRGSIFGDTLMGDSAINRIEGLAGDDTLIGGLGGDVLVGGDGIDTVSYEENWGMVTANLTLGQGFGNAAQGDTYQGIENARGGMFADTLIGDGGANRLMGGLGNDTLVGAGGADTFVMETPLDSASNVDLLLDFASGVDRIELKASVFAGIATGTLTSAAFGLGTTATTADQRILYDGATGNLYYDADGIGGTAAVPFATLTTAPGLAATDFLIAP